ncbi:isochorismatase family protein [Shewanella sp. YLB-07]|uniref:isochorismatase family protein n=1 Tax=Shewanella sp. YLB-07 TaxID=2601268 RepID=UPI002AD2743E|nr:isochorismatase family protein [Shewanella sp. YLB-07]
MKLQINSFRSTELHFFLKALNVEKLVIVGVMSHMCIDAVTQAVMDLGYYHVEDDACSTLELEFNGVTVPVNHAFMTASQFGCCNVGSTENHSA